MRTITPAVHKRLRPRLYQHRLMERDTWQRLYAALPHAFDGLLLLSARIETDTDSYITWEYAK